MLCSCCFLAPSSISWSCQVLFFGAVLEYCMKFLCVLMCWVVWPFSCTMLWLFFTCWLSDDSDVLKYSLNDILVLFVLLFCCCFCLAFSCLFNMQCQSVCLSFYLSLSFLFSHCPSVSVSHFSLVEVLVRGGEDSHHLGSIAFLKTHSNAP